MKFKTGLVILFLLACCFAVTGVGAAADVTPQPPVYYYYALVPYEQPAGDAQHYPAYLPAEFARKNQPAQQQPQMMVVQQQPLATAVPASDFVPYDAAKAQYSGELISTQPLPAAPQVPPPAAASNQDFVPYEYAREKYSN